MFAVDGHNFSACKNLAPCSVNSCYFLSLLKQHFSTSLPRPLPFIFSFRPNLLLVIISLVTLIVSATDPYSKLILSVMVAAVHEFMSPIWLTVYVKAPDILGAVV